MNNEDIFEAFSSIDDKYITEAAKPRTTRKRPMWLPLGAAAAIVLLIAVGIFIRSEKPHPVYTSETDYYSLFSQNDQYYLKLHDGKIINSGTSDSCEDMKIDWSLYFDSLSEMQSDLVSGNFTEQEMFGIRHMETDALGRITLPDLSNLYEPTYPFPLTGYSVWWNADQYGFYLNSKYYDLTAGIHPVSQQEYIKGLETITEFEANHKNIVETLSVSDRNAKVYHLKSYPDDSLSKYVHYVITVPGSKTIYIEEYYEDINDACPAHIRFFGDQNGTYFIGAMGNLSSRPSVLSLSALGLKKYTP